MTSTPGSPWGGVGVLFGESDRTVSPTSQTVSPVGGDGPVGVTPTLAGNKGVSGVGVVEVRPTLGRNPWTPAAEVGSGPTRDCRGTEARPTRQGSVWYVRDHP